MWVSNQLKTNTNLHSGWDQGAVARIRGWWTVHCECSTFRQETKDLECESEGSQYPGPEGAGDWFYNILSSGCLGPSPSRESGPILRWIFNAAPRTESVSTCAGEAAHDLRISRVPYCILMCYCRILKRLQKKNASEVIHSFVLVAHRY